MGLKTYSHVVGQGTGRGQGYGYNAPYYYGAPYGHSPYGYPYPVASRQTSVQPDATR